VCSFISVCVFKALTSLHDTEIRRLITSVIYSTEEFYFVVADCWD